MEPTDRQDRESEDAEASSTSDSQRSEDDLQPLGGTREPEPTQPPPPRHEGQAAARPEEPSPAPGQELPGSWPYVKAIMAAEKLFAALLIIMALEALCLFALGEFAGAAVAAAILWGVLTLQWWGYVLAVGLSAVFVGVMVIMLGVTALVNAKAGLAGAVAFAVPIAVGIFALAVLYTRRQHFT